MSVALIGWIIAGITSVPLALLLGHFIKQATALRVENESLKKTDAAQDKQLAVAARPAVSGSTVLDELSDGKL
jgi:hypothetical protein